MTSSTRNIRIGVCRAFFDGKDLGLTKGGVEVTVTTETHKTSVDQFGNTTVEETIQGREIKVKVPMVETGLDQLVQIMPGATKSGSAGVAQVSTATMPGSPAASSAYSIYLNGRQYEAITDGAPTAGELALALVAAINADETAPASASTVATGASTSATVVLTAKASGTFTPTASAGINIAQTTAGVNDRYRVDVKVGTGTSLLASARKLVLHPVRLDDADKSEDLILPLAATAGQMNFSYKLEEERTFPVEFTGYPDGTGKLFSYGDESA